MDQAIAALTGALISGAIAASKDLGGNGLRDAYSGLKKILEDTYDFATSKLIEAEPESDAFRTALHSEISGKPDAVRDLKVQDLVRALLDALASIPEADGRAAGIDVKKIKAGRDLIASGGWIKGEHFEGGRDVVLTANSEARDRLGKP